MQHLLEMRNLSIDLYRGKKRAPVKLVEGIDLDIDKKQTFGVVGESGCGKSITCSSIMGLLSFPLSVGEGSSIRFQRSDGSESELLHLSPKELHALRGKDISMIFQEPMTALDPMYCIEDQIVESLQFHTNLSRSEMHDQALEMLKKVKIPRPEQILKDYPHHLSGGMLQRVMIAIALINNPRLLIADEPTTALDVTIQAQVLMMIRDLRDRLGTSMIMITHDLGIVAQTCDNVAVMYAGEIIELGTAEDIFTHTKHHPYTDGLFASLPNLKSKTTRLQPIAGLMPDPTNLPKGCKFAPRCGKCMEICKEVPPEVYTDGTHSIRCHLFHQEKED